jgi:hypothetical protein
MDPITSCALIVTLTAVGFYILYLVVYHAVKNAIRDAKAPTVKQKQS